MNNGFSSAEEDSRGPVDQMCCLMDDGGICRNAAGNASYSKRIQKTVAQRRLKLTIAPSVSTRRERPADQHTHTPLPNSHTATNLSVFRIRP